MRTLRFFALALTSIMLAPLGALAGEEGYYRYPTIHADTIVFSAEGDLWKVSATGGQASRITTQGVAVAYPRFSPDGKWLAFSEAHEGNVDVYVMPAEGGEPRRLSFHPASDDVVAWTPDSTNIVFRSNRNTVHWEEHLYQVPLTGGPVTELPIGTASLIAFSPDGKNIAFNRWSTEFRTWKRYRGGTAPQIWTGDLSTNTFKKMTTWIGSNDFPMWSSDDGGRIYYLADPSGRANIVSSKPDGSDFKEHTHHADFDARWPDLGDGRIAYMLGADIWLFDTKSGQDRKVAITLPSERPRLQPRFEDASKTVEGYALNHEGTKLVVNSRGQVWVSPVKDGRIVQLTSSSGIRHRAPVFSPDGKEVAVISDETGEQELVVYSADGKGPHRKLTAQGKGWIFDPVWSPDGEHIAYSDLTMSLYVVNAETGTAKTVDTSTNGEIREYAFSPDGEWLAYTKPRSPEDGLGYSAGEVRVYNIDDAKSYPVSSAFTSDSSPAWDPKGKYLYFLSARTFNPTTDERDWAFSNSKTTKVYAAILEKHGLSPFLPDELLNPDDEKGKDGKDAKSKSDSKDKDKGKSEKNKDADAAKDKAKDRDKDKDKEKDAESERELPEVKLDPEGLQSRVVEFPVEPDNYAGLSAIDGKVFYESTPTPGMLEDFFGKEDDRPKNTLHVFDLKEKKADVFIESLRDYTLSEDGTKLAYRVKEDISVVGTEAPPGKGGPEAEKDHKKEGLEPSKLRLIVNPRQEFAQIFNEAWRLQRDFYWTETMAGLDWPAMRDRYGSLLPRVSTRSELNDLIGQLIAELGTSHTYVFGGDTGPAPKQKPVEWGLLGADLVYDSNAKAWRFTRILRPEVWETDVESPLLMPHAHVAEGEYLFAINNRPVTAGDDVYLALAGLADEQVLLSIGAAADQSDARDVQIKAIDPEHEHALRYRDWCRRNREYAALKSGGKIGYFHMPDMGGPGLIRFVEGFYPQLRKQALIVDDRYNGGGNISPMLIEKLARQPYAFTKPRRGVTTTYPENVSRGYKCCLINHWSASDGDIFPESFKLKGLGPIIGTRSWGGVIGIRGDKNFIDGGTSTQPEFAWWEPKRGWDLENRGVEPDIELETNPADEALGKDSVLDRAIAEMIQKIEANPIPTPVAPPLPNKMAPRSK